MIRKYLLGGLIWIVYRLWSWTWRIDLEEPESMLADLRNRKPFILAHWHGDELALLVLIQRYRIATITSTSKDGELIDAFIRMSGGSTSRGSSTRGGVSALKGLITLAKSGHNCSFAVDGPKGPIYKVKPGVFEVSRLMRAPIYAAGILCDRAIHFPKSWNQAYFPKPFAKIKIVWRGPLGPAQRDTNPRDKNIAQELEDLLHSAKDYARKVFAGNDP